MLEGTGVPGPLHVDACIVYEKNVIAVGEVKEEEA